MIQARFATLMVASRDAKARVVDPDSSHAPAALQRLSGRAESRIARVISGALHREVQLRQLGSSVHTALHRAELDLIDDEHQLSEVLNQLHNFKLRVGADTSATAIRPWIGYSLIGSVFLGEIYFQGLALDALGVGGIGRWLLSAGISVALIWLAHIAAHLLRKSSPTLIEKITAGICLALPVILISVLAYWRQTFLNASEETSSNGLVANLLIALMFFLVAFAYSYFAAEPIALERRNLTGKLQATRRQSQKSRNRCDASAAMFQRIEVLRTGNQARAAQIVEEWRKLHEKAGAPYRGRYARACTKVGEPVPEVILSRVLDIESPAWLSEPIDWAYLNCVECADADGALAIPNALGEAGSSITTDLEVTRQ